METPLFGKSEDEKEVEVDPGLVDLAENIF